MKSVIETLNSKFQVVSNSKMASQHYGSEKFIYSVLYKVLFAVCSLVTAAHKARILEKYRRWIFSGSRLAKLHQSLILILNTTKSHRLTCRYQRNTYQRLLLFLFFLCFRQQLEVNSCVMSDERMCRRKLIMKASGVGSILSAEIGLLN